MPRRTPEIALLGPGSLAGQETLGMLAERLPDSNVSSFGEHTVGQQTPWGEIRPRSELEPERFDYVLLATHAEDSEELIELFLEDSHGAIFDYSSLRRMDPDVEIIVPPVNAEVLDPERRLMAVPNCTSAILVVAAAPIHEVFRIERMTVSTYQAVSGAGRAAVTELERRTAAKLEGVEGPPPQVFSEDIAFQAIPNVPEEEEKLSREPGKILADPRLEITAHCVRIPVPHGHSMWVDFETVHAMEQARIEELLHRAEGVVFYPERRPTTNEAVGQDDVYVGGLQVNPENPRRGTFWVIGDNLRRGAGLNGVEAIEYLLELERQAA